MVNSYVDLEVYRVSLEIAKRVYLITKDYPKDEIYGLRDQVRRAAASIGANIAEGFGRYHYKDKLLFFYNARGSIYETMHFIELSFLVGYISDEVKEGLLGELKTLSVKLNNFINSVGNHV